MDEPSGSYVGTASGSVDPELLTRHVSDGALMPSFSSEREAWNAIRLDSQRAVLKRLQAWHQWDIDRYKSPSKFLLSRVGFPKRPVRPTRAQLLSLATYFFPSRGSLKVVVCDFGEGRFERIQVDSVDIHQCKSLTCPRRDGLTLRYRIRLAGQTNVGDCTVDVCFPNSNALDVTDVQRHVPVGSGSVESVRPNFISPLCFEIGRAH